MHQILRTLTAPFRSDDRPLEIFVFEQNDIGVFAQLALILMAAAYCEEAGRRPFFVVRNTNLVTAGRAANWIDDFFIQPQVRPADHALAKDLVNAGKFHRIQNRYDLNQIARRGRHTELQNELDGVTAATRLIKGCLAIKPEVRRIATRFVAETFNKAPFIAVHYRGTCKVGREAGEIDFGRVTQTIDTYTCAERIFIATDSPAFLAHCEARYGERIAVMTPPTGLSHLKDQGDNFVKSRAAIVDCLILSQARLLIKTPSQLSGFSKVFNPALDLVLIDTPFEKPHGEIHLRGHGYWPENCLYDADPATMRRYRILARYA